MKETRFHRVSDMRQVLAVIMIILGFGAVTIVRVRLSMPVSVPPDPVALHEGTAEAGVRTAVQHFGVKMRNVPLAASKEIAAASIEETYSGIVWPDLLSSWMKNPSEAPGRFVSSPWPDHIDVSSITPMTDAIYAVEGSVAEITSNEIVNGGVADRYPVFLTVENADGRWLITDYKDSLIRK